MNHIDFNYPIDHTNKVVDSFNQKQVFETFILIFFLYLYTFLISHKIVCIANSVLKALAFHQPHWIVMFFITFKLQHKFSIKTNTQRIKLKLKGNLKV